MDSTLAARADLCRLRRDIARLEGRLDADAATLASGLARPHRGFHLDPANPAYFGPRRRPKRLRLGVAALDESIGGGLSLATLHEIRACESRDGGAAAGFALAL